MNIWRLLELETHNAYTNMAIDEAILTARIRNVAPNTIRFYRWNPSAVSIGKFQNVDNEVHLKNCQRRGIDVVRRITGGGTVYHDAEGEITYSVIASKEDLNSKDIAAVYAKIYAGLAEAINILGLCADFNEGDAKTCPNLTVNGKKISGSAQSHKGTIVLQHGTLLLDVDLEKMFTFLRVPWAKASMKIVNVAKNKITSIRNEIEKDVSEAEVHQALIKGFQKSLNIQLENGRLIPYELDLAEKLHKEKYATDDWNFKGTAQTI
jgi:lipoate-protein ligase A